MRSLFTLVVLLVGFVLGLAAAALFGTHIDHGRNALVLWNCGPGIDSAARIIQEACP